MGTEFCEISTFFVKMPVNVHQLNLQNLRVLLRLALLSFIVFCKGDELPPSYDNPWTSRLIASSRECDEGPEEWERVLEIKNVVE